MTSSMVKLLTIRIAGNQTVLALAVHIDARNSRQLQARRANKAELVFCDQAIDLTYIRLERGWMYLVVVLDWFARYVVSWALSETLEIDFVLEAVDAALSQAKPEIWNSDQGRHFTSPLYTQRLLNAQVRISMDGKGRALDNIFTERFWRSLKYEEVYLHHYDSPRAARAGITRYIALYNAQRPHQALEYRTPMAVYFASPPLVTVNSFANSDRAECTENCSN